MKKYKYDVAISVAEDDLDIAQKIVVALRKLNITYYLYTEHQAKNWGGHLLQITQDAYGSEARYVLMLTSRNYVQKYWPDVEHQIAKISSAGKEISILQLRLDEAQVDGLKYRVFIDWNSNPGEIAAMLKEKLQQEEKAPLIFGKSKTLPQAATGWRRKWLVAGALVICTLVAVGFLLRRTKSSASKVESYYISVAGNNTDLNNMINNYVKNSVKTHGLELAPAEETAGNTIHLSVQETTTTLPSGDGPMQSTCNYELKITGPGGSLLNSNTGNASVSGNNRKSNLNKLAGQVAKKINSFLPGRSE